MVAVQWRSSLIGLGVVLVLAGCKPGRGTDESEQAVPEIPIEAVPR